MPGDRLAAAVRNLPAAWHGQYFDVVDSTQARARAAARDGAPTRSLVVADFQHAGRGRGDRQWLAPPGSALLLSMLFREHPQADAITPWRYTSLASVALMRTIARYVPDTPTAIKWPNDLMLHDRKVAGVLAETTWDGHALEVVVGVGLNVSSAPAELPGATCLRAAADGRLDRGDLLLTFVSQLDSLSKEPHDVVFECWQSHLWGRGQRLRLRDRDLEDEVIVLGANADGSLNVRSNDGRERITVTGELLA